MTEDLIHDKYALHHASKEMSYTGLRRKSSLWLQDLVFDFNEIQRQIETRKIDYAVLSALSGIGLRCGLIFVSSHQ